jgi:hypothetical protein
MWSSVEHSPHLNYNDTSRKHYILFALYFSRPSIEFTPLLGQLTTEISFHGSANIMKGEDNEHVWIFFSCH